MDQLGLTGLGLTDRIAAVDVSAQAESLAVHLACIVITRLVMQYGLVIVCIGRQGPFGSRRHVYHTDLVGQLRIGTHPWAIH